MKEHQASPELSKFFENLLDIKKFVLEKAKTSSDSCLMEEIYTKLDKIIKEG